MDSIKSLPQNVEAEKEVLSCIIQNEKILCDIAEMLKPEDFYNIKNQIIYETVLDLFKEDTKISSTTIITKLGSNIKQISVSYIAQLIGYTVAIEKQAIASARVIKELSKRRKIIQQSQLLLQEAYDTKNDLSQLLGKFENEITFTEDKSNMWTMEQTMSSTLETVENNYNSGGKVVGMETGLTTLDRALNGLQKGDVVTIAGRPSMGKTIFSLNLAERLSRKHSVYYASLEMRKEKLGMRMVAAKSRINSLKISTGNISDNEWEKLAKDSSLLANNNLVIDDSSELSMIDIKARCKKLKMQYKLDVIIIDHIGLLKAHTKQSTRNLEVGDMSRMGKVIAKELDCVVIFLSQLSRACESRADHRPILADLRESGNIEQDTDVAIMLYRDEYYNKESEDKGIMEAIIRKSRDGQLGTVKLAYLEQYQLIGELDYIH